MRSANSRVKLLFILLLVEASLVCSLEKKYSYWNETTIQQWESGVDFEVFDDSEDYLSLRRGFNLNLFKILESMRKNRPKPPPRGNCNFVNYSLNRMHKFYMFVCGFISVDPYGIVTIKLDMWNKTHDSYMANVTIIFNYLEKQNIEGTWELMWTWYKDEILLSTVGAKGTQHGYVSTGDDTCCLNSVTFVDLPPQIVHNDQLNIVPNCSEGGLIPPWLKEADLAKSSCSFQIFVSQAQANIEYHWPPKYVTLIKQGLKYKCDQLVELAVTTPGYQSKIIALLYI